MVRTGYLKVGATVLMLSFMSPFLVIQAAFADEPARQVVYAETGEASWYGPGLKGKRTASGERFDPKKPTAPIPSSRSAARRRSPTSRTAGASRSRSTTVAPASRAAPSTCRRPRPRRSA